MKFAKEMAFYSAFHQERRNILIHIIGVPTITFSLLLVMSWVNLFEISGFPITLAIVFSLLVLAYYFTLDLGLASLTAIFFGGLLFAAHWLSLNVSDQTGWIIFGAGQILGWGTQFYGHFAFEKSRPALFDNLFQALVSAPLFVVADVCFELGFRKELEKDVKDTLKERGQYKEFA